MQTTDQYIRKFFFSQIKRHLMQILALLLSATGCQRGAYVTVDFDVSLQKTAKYAKQNREVTKFECVQTVHCSIH